MEGTGEGVLIGDPGNKATSTLGTVNLLLGMVGQTSMAGLRGWRAGQGRQEEFLCLFTSAWKGIWQARGACTILPVKWAFNYRLDTLIRE